MFYHIQRVPLSFNDVLKAELLSHLEIAHFINLDETLYIAKKEGSYFISNDSSFTTFKDISLLSKEGSVLREVIDTYQRCIDTETDLETDYNKIFKDVFQQFSLNNDSPSKIFHDGMRWRALMNSPCIRILGQSGLAKYRKPIEEGAGYAHFGMEIWSLKSPGFEKHYDLNYGREILTEYADQMLRNLELQKEMSIDVILPEMKEGLTLSIKGVNAQLVMEIDSEITAVLLGSEDPVESIRRYVKSLGIPVDVIVR